MNAVSAAWFQLQQSCFSPQCLVRCYVLALGKNNVRKTPMFLFLLNGAVQNQGRFSFLTFLCCPASKRAGGHKEQGRDRSRTPVLKCQRDNPYVWNHARKTLNWGELAGGLLLLEGRLFISQHVVSNSTVNYLFCEYMHYYCYFTLFSILVTSFYLNLWVPLFFLLSLPSHLDNVQWEKGCVVLAASWVKAQHPASIAFLAFSCPFIIAAVRSINLPTFQQAI